MNKEEAIQKMINEKRWRLPDDVFLDAGYVSPIKQIVSDWQMTMEENVMKAVQQVGIHVDKEELIKALQYDREQFAKGYKAGIEKGHKDMLGQRAIKGKWLWDQDGNKFCSNCRTGTDRETNVSVPLFEYCPYCGSDNREGEEAIG